MITLGCPHVGYWDAPAKFWRSLFCCGFPAVWGLQLFAISWWKSIFKGWLSHQMDGILTRFWFKSLWSCVVNPFSVSCTSFYWLTCHCLVAPLPPRFSAKEHSVHDSIVKMGYFHRIYLFHPGVHPFAEHPIFFAFVPGLWQISYMEIQSFGWVNLQFCLKHIFCLTIAIKHIFPECVARVPVSLWGSGGWAVFDKCCSTVRNRSQPFARGRYGRAYGKFCKRGHFWMFPASRRFVLRGRRGSNMFHDMSKVVSCGRRNTFATFSEDALQFSWQAQHFADFRCHFAWQSQHFQRVGLRIYRESHCQGCAKWWQGANSVAAVAFSDMWWKLTEASHETSILR